MFNLCKRFLWWCKQKKHKLACFNRRCKLCEWYLPYDLHQHWMGLVEHTSDYSNLFIFKTNNDNTATGKLFFENSLLEILNGKKLRKAVQLDNIKNSLRDELVVQMAIQIWEDSGKLDGQDDTNWQIAEKTVDNCFADCVYVYSPDGYLSVTIRHLEPRTEEVRRLDQSIPYIR